MTRLSQGAAKPETWGKCLQDQSPAHSTRSSPGTPCYGQVICPSIHHNYPLFAMGCQVCTRPWKIRKKSSLPETQTQEPQFFYPQVQHGPAAPKLTQTWYLLSEGSPSVLPSGPRSDSSMPVMRKISPSVLGAMVGTFVLSPPSMEKRAQSPQFQGDRWP